MPLRSALPCPLTWLLETLDIESSHPQGSPPRLQCSQTLPPKAAPPTQQVSPAPILHPHVSSLLCDGAGQVG